MATLILARHGRTTANATGVLAGRSKGVRLDAAGLDQARAAGERLAALPLAAIVTSPLERCRDTAREVHRLQPSGPKVSSDRRLLECDYGSWTGRELKTLAKEPLWATVQAHPSAVTFPDGESMAQMMARAVAAVRDWDARVEAESGPDAVWLAVTHGDVIKAVLADALGMHLDLFQRIGVDPASLSVVRYTPLRPFVLSVNSVAGDLSGLRPPKRRRGRRRRGESDAPVGGGAGTVRGGDGGAGEDDEPGPTP
ncbi:MAG TPA: histidine phosphatase family protein [Nocardioidaceae bacterium]